jgi:hypothetical protein
MTRHCCAPLALLLVVVQVGTTIRAQGTVETVFAGRVTGGTVWSLLLQPAEGGAAIAIPVGEDGSFRQQIERASEHYVLATDPPCTPVSMELSEDATGVLNLVRAGRPDEVIDVSTPGISSIRTERTGLSFKYTPGGGFAFSTPSTKQFATFDGPGSRVTSGGLGIGSSGRLAFSMSNMLGGVRMTTGVCTGAVETDVR